MKQAEKFNIQKEEKMTPRQKCVKNRIKNTMEIEKFRKKSY